MQESFVESLRPALAYCNPFPLSSGMLQTCTRPCSTPPQASGWPNLATLDITGRFFTTVPPHLVDAYSALNPLNLIVRRCFLWHEEATDGENHGNKSLQRWRWSMQPFRRKHPRFTASCSGYWRKRASPTLGAGQATNDLRDRPSSPPFNQSRNLFFPRITKPTFSSLALYLGTTCSHRHFLPISRSACIFLNRHAKQKMLHLLRKQAHTSFTAAPHFLHFLMRYRFTHAAR